MELSYSKEEEDEEEKDMANQNMEWMTKGPLAVLAALHKIPKNLERMLMMYDPDGVVKAKNHFDNFYI